jgi:hypothetical protein
MRGGGMMGADGMHSGMMMRMLFAMMSRNHGPRLLTITPQDTATSMLQLAPRQRHFRGV